MKRALVLLVIAVAACGGKAVFRLSSDENNPYQLGQTLARRQLPATPTPTNSAGTPRLFAVAAGKAGTKTLVAFDLASGNALWKADGDIQSRIAVGGDFVVALEGKDLVARDQARGAVRWRVGLPGTYVGHAADRERVYAVYQTGSTYWLAGYSGDGGSQLWKADASGKLGAPAAHGGVVYVPFLSQWLSIVDGKTGEQLTRIRGIDEQISVLRVTSQAAYYGSKQGIFQLDTRSASGKRGESTYGTAIVPPQLERTNLGRDIYDPIQAGYSAFDRTRVLYASEPSSSTTTSPLRFSGDTYAVHYFRFVFGFSPDGAITWAYSHPRVELVASEHTGPGGVIAGVSTSGEVVALDPATGAVRAKQSLGIAEPILGATFDADGWAPSGQVDKPDTLAALVSIARDHDARFDRVKELAVRTLAKRTEPAVTGELLAVLGDKRAPMQLKDTVVELLVQRRDPASLPVLVAQLAIRTDYLAQTEPEGLDSVAKAIAGLAGDAAANVDPKQAAAAIAALTAHLDDPTTATTDLVLVIAAMSAVGNGRERAALGSHLLLYHADDELGGDNAWQQAIVGALVRGGPQERELLRAVSEDPRTRPGLVTAIREAIAP